MMRSDWRRYRPLGIACAATLASDDSQPKVWYGKTLAGSPAEKMRQQETAALAEYLDQMTEAGYRIVTWNGLAFDFNILAEESAAKEICKRLAWNHVDMMFHVFCKQGYRVALDRAAQGMGIVGKKRGMSGILAPRLWAECRYQEVLDYVSQDVRITLNLAQRCQESGAFRWITQKGTRQRLDLPEGWLTAKAAFVLPLPDTSWMRNPATARRLYRLAPLTG